MSVRTHAPDCAKTLALNSGESGPVECTCGATYQPGVATSEEFDFACREASRLETERDEARLLAERWRDRAANPNFLCGGDVLPWEGGT